jgi:hypothetical protein
MLDSSNVNHPSILSWRRMRKGRFIIPEEDPTIYPHTRLSPVIMRVTAKQNPSHMELPLCWRVPFQM